MKKPAAFLLPLPLLALLGCGGTGAVLSNTPPTVRGVVAKVWKNGAELYSYGVPQASVYAYGLAFSGPDLYWVGTQWNQNQPRLLLGKNGGTPRLLTGTTRPSEGYGLAVDGTDVYVAGSESSGGPTQAPVPVAKVWKNGVATTLTDGTRTSLATGLALSGSDVYVSGYESNGSVTVAKIWKNGTLYQTLGDGTAGSAANGLAFSGTDLLAAGWQSTSAAKAATSWRNGTPQPALTDGSTDAEAMAVRPSGADVYQVGYATVP